MGVGLGGWILPAGKILKQQPEFDARDAEDWKPRVWGKVQ